jgi:hypothetical protein
MSTPQAIAQWMLTQVPVSGFLSQSRVARVIRTTWGEDFVYKNKNRNWAIRPDILEAFRAITEGQLMWSRSRQAWRRRRPGDPEGRMIR